MSLLSLETKVGLKDLIFPLIFMKLDVSIMCVKCQPVSSQDFSSASNCPLYHRHYQVNGVPPPLRLTPWTCQAMDARATGCSCTEFLNESDSKLWHLPGRSEQGYTTGCSWTTQPGKLLECDWKCAWELLKRQRASSPSNSGVLFDDI